MGYTPEVPPDDLDQPAAYDRDLASPSSGANMPSGDELSRRWQEVVEALEAINALEPSDDVNDRLGEARRKLRITELQNVVRALTANRNWTAVLAADDELTRLDPEAGDPDGLASKASAELLDAELAASYAQGVKQLKEQDWTGAEATFRALLDRRASYRDVRALFALARRQGGPRRSPSIRPSHPQESLSPRVPSSRERKWDAERRRIRRLPSLPGRHLSRLFSTEIGSTRPWYKPSLSRQCR